jgi:hypothetical protein
MIFGYENLVMIKKELLIIIPYKYRSESKKLQSIKSILKSFTMGNEN